MNKYKILIDPNQVDSEDGTQDIELIKNDSIISLKGKNLNKYKILVDRDC